MHGATLPGHPWGAPDDIATLPRLTANLPSDWIFSAFSIGRNQLPYIGLALPPAATSASGSRTISGSTRACLPPMGPLVERAVKIAEDMGSRIMGPADVRGKMKLQKR